MHIVLVGMNYRSAPVEIRERLAFRREQLADALATLRGRVGLHEAAILSTCNRIEIYAGVPTLDGTIDRLQQFLSAHSHLALDGLVPQLYCYTEPHSIRHLFSVTSGLDSMVLGEAEILYQVKHAYQWAKEHGATGKALNTLFQRALNTAKAVRSQTAIGHGATSVGSVAVELAEKIFGRLSQASVLLIGAGTLGELTLTRLVDRGVTRLHIMNRSPDRAAGLAAGYGATPQPFNELAASLQQVDIIITSTNAPSAIIARAEVAAAMRLRHQHPLCLIDLGVPRNIDPAVSRLENVYLFNIDDLQGLVAHSHEQRQQALGQSQAIIEEKVDRFLDWWREELSPCDPSSLGPVAAP